MKGYALNSGTVLHGSNYDYTIERVLGNGTFGITYLAKVKMKGSLGSLDAKLNVAIKEFFMRDFNGREGSSVTYSSKEGAFTYYKSKFIHEAENLSKLHSPGIVNVLELFESNQTAYYVMDYLPNGSLDEYIKAKRLLPFKKCIDYAIQISEALKYMHDNQMLHLDLKPGNIMIDEHDKLVLIDFGLSKQFDQWGNPETSTTIGHGTPGYAPVEQAHYQENGNKGLPASMDIYALGATIFKMLTGHRPPEASIILNEGFPTDELVSVNTPVEFIDVVRTCMEPMRKNRYRSMKEVIVALSTILQMDEDSERTEPKQDNEQPQKNVHQSQNAKREKERKEENKNNEDNASLDSEELDRSDSLSKNQEPITIIDFLVTIGNIAMGVYFLSELFSLSFWPYLIMPVIVYMYKVPKYKHYYESSSLIGISIFLQWLMTWDIDYSILGIDPTWGVIGTSILLILLNAIIRQVFGDKWGCAFITFATTIALFLRL